MIFSIEKPPLSFFEADSLRLNPRNRHGFAVEIL